MAEQGYSGVCLRVVSVLVFVLPSMVIIPPRRTKGHLNRYVTGILVLCSVASCHVVSNAYQQQPSLSSGRRRSSRGLSQQRMSGFVNPEQVDNWGGQASGGFNGLDEFINVDPNQFPAGDFDDDLFNSYVALPSANAQAQLGQVDDYSQQQFMQQHYPQHYYPNLEQYAQQTQVTGPYWPGAQHQVPIEMSNYFPQDPTFVAPTTENIDPALAEQHPRQRSPGTLFVQDSENSPRGGSTGRKRRMSTISEYASTDASERKRLKLSRQVRGHGSKNQLGFKLEKPKMRGDKPWVRVNGSTRGLTTRSAKINRYTGAGYEVRPHPIGKAWQTPSGFTFDYTEKWEFKKVKYSAEELNAFIFEYPYNKKTHAKLKLWLQKTPTDSAFRYNSPFHSKCRFKHCPSQLYEQGRILHGHYRIAFDERWHANGMNVDPYHVAGFVHLYCMERFLDFEEVCKLGIVEVDTRSMPNEPKMRFAATLHGQAELPIAQEFIEACKNDDLRNVTEFRNYPVHEQFRRGQEKPHKDTLTYHMHMVKLLARPPSQIKELGVDRVLKPSNVLVHKGNLEVHYLPKRQTKAKKSKRKNQDEVQQEIDRLVEEARQEVQELIGGDPKRPAYTPRKRKQPVKESSDEESDSDSDSDSVKEFGDDSDSEVEVAVTVPQKKGVRASPRLKYKTRPAYNPPDSPQHTQPPSLKRQRKDSLPSEDPPLPGKSPTTSQDMQPPPPKRQRKGSIPPSEFPFPVQPIQVMAQLDSEPLPPLESSHPVQPIQDMTQLDSEVEWHHLFNDLDPLPEDFDYSEFDLEKHLGDFDSSPAGLTRRRSSAFSSSIRRSRARSVLKNPALNSSPNTPGGSKYPNRRVSIGRTTTNVFDTALSPKENLRRSSRAR
ncbi:hypothetical protein M011DRAFT_465580 [Sporormia fimetaria CBS 119925]|uniref:Uncharacterized protein n=1 Tax=Sporormia fimetaria CBS 119925 TaxID=1340428 RepID=A0A6A6VH67_9PLEO|nr:hypothetical protein M011DRAFT_465580 [Sporormia fimetaria CBS 119925]